jgi:hypothetical protein
MQVMAKLKAESGPKKVVVGALLAASQAYVLAARTVSGMSLAHAQAPPTPLQLVWAQVMAALLRPLHQLAGKLVFSKVGGPWEEGCIAFKAVARGTITRQQEHCLCSVRRDAAAGATWHEHMQWCTI